MRDVLETLKLQLLTLQKKLQSQEPKTLYEAARRQLGNDASPRDRASDELGCAESVSEIIQDVLPDFPVVTGTYTLWILLSHDKRFRQVTNNLPGTIIISPTGTARKHKFPGHVGICGFSGTIMSNNSRTGIFEENYTLQSWEKRYEVEGGYPVYFFELR